MDQGIKGSSLTLFHFPYGSGGQALRLYERTGHPVKFFHGLLCPSGHGRYCIFPTNQSRFQDQTKYTKYLKRNPKVINAIMQGLTPVLTGFSQFPRFFTVTRVSITSLCKSKYQKARA
jgi:hypothetical protein